MRGLQGNALSSFLPSGSGGQGRRSTLGSGELNSQRWGNCDRNFLSYCSEVKPRLVLSSFQSEES